MPPEPVCTAALPPRAVVDGLWAMSDAIEKGEDLPSDARELVKAAIELHRGRPDSWGLRGLHHLDGALLTGGPLPESAAGVCQVAAAAIWRFDLLGDADDSVLLPRPMMPRRDVTPAAKLVYGAVLSFSGEDNAVVGLDRLAQATGATDSQVRETVQKLIDAGLVVREGDGFRIARAAPLEGGDT